MLVTLGLTPALQRVMVFDRLTPDTVNRAAETHTSAAGKAINAARAARIFRPEMSIAAASVFGGTSGHFLATALSSVRIIGRSVESPRETRTCVTLLDRSANTVTELVEESQKLSPELLDQVLAKVKPADVLICSGSLTPECPPDFYARAAVQVPRAHLIVDARGSALLAAIGAPTRGFRIAKLNSQELLATTGAPHLTSGILALGAAGATHVIVTDGPHKLHIFDGQRHLTLTPPKVEAVNPIGCGDCLAGVLGAALHESEDDFLKAAKEAIAASAASAETLLPAEFDPTRQKALLGQIRA